MSCLRIVWCSWCVFVCSIMLVLSCVRCGLIVYVFLWFGFWIMSLLVLSDVSIWCSEVFGILMLCVRLVSDMVLLVWMRCLSSVKVCSVGVFVGSMLGVLEIGLWLLY